MSTFDLGNDLTVERDVPLTTARAYALCRRVVVGYEGQGYQVAFEAEHPPESLTAVISGKGALLGVEVEVTPGERSSHLRIELRGQVQVTGMQAMFATAPLVRKIAREKLVEFLDKTIADVEPSPPDAFAPTAPEAAPNTAQSERELTIKVLPKEEREVPVSKAKSTLESEPTPASKPTPSSNPKRGSAPATASTPLERRLATVRALHERGLISSADYTSKKQNLLAEL